MQPQRRTLACALACCLSQAGTSLAGRIAPPLPSSAADPAKLYLSVLVEGRGGVIPFARVVILKENNEVLGAKNADAWGQVRFEFPDPDRAIQQVVIYVSAQGFESKWVNVAVENRGTNLNAAQNLVGIFLERDPDFVDPGWI